MVSNNKNHVQLVISHLEGCSGNFLGYLAASQMPANRDFFRVDSGLNDHVLSINGRCTWHSEIDQRLAQHSVVVTHNFDRALIARTFPNARIVQIYPYTCVGNVLYNVCAKKLDISIANRVDNHLINIREWHQRIQAARPQQQCWDFAQLQDRDAVERMLEIKLRPEQDEFFHCYWSNQLGYELDLPRRPMTITQLLDFWRLHDFCNDWSMAWVIFAFESCNHLREENRLWSIDDADFLQGWQQLLMIENLYRTTA